MGGGEYRGTNNYRYRKYIIVLLGDFDEFDQVPGSGVSTPGPTRACALVNFACALVNPQLMVTASGLAANWYELAQKIIDIIMMVLTSLDNHKI